MKQVRRRRQRLPSQQLGKPKLPNGVIT